MSLSVKVNAYKKDGRVQFEIMKSNEDMGLKTMRSLLMGALCLTIRAEDTPEEQGRAMREVIEYLHSDFSNADSFDDIKKDF